MVAVVELLDLSQMKIRKIPSRLLYKNARKVNSFQESMRWPLALLQIFGFFPVKGTTSSNYRDLEFKWISWRVAVSMLCLFGYLCQFLGFCIKKKIDKLVALNAALFHLEGAVLSVLFIILAKSWPNFVKEWHLIELSMRTYKLSENVGRKIAMVLISILGLAFIEHCMVVAQNIMLVSEVSNIDPIHEYMVNQQFTEIFQLIPYTLVLGIFFQILIIQKTFIWSFVDVFIIIISICFNFRLKQIAKKLEHLSRIEVSDHNVWRAIRENYVKVSGLCNTINVNLSWLIIISYLSNIYYILSQLFSSLRPIENTFHKIYFCVSFFLLILRVTTVCVFGGAIYDEHEHIVRILTTVPSAAYNIEVERFVLHLGTSETAITGKNFFKITRNLVLKVTSAIVTYELVLIQFNQQEFKTRDT